jgi:hypothetical protein
VKVKDKQGKHASRCSYEGGAVSDFELTCHRLRVKQTIAELESRVEDLTTQLIATKLENDSLKAENQLAPPGSIPQQLVPGSIPLDDPFENYPGLDAVQQRHLHASQYMPIDSQFAESSMMSIPIGTGEWTLNSPSGSIY